MSSRPIRITDELSVGGGAPLPVTQDKATDWGPAWSADGAWLFFMSDRGGPANLWRIRIDEQSGCRQGC